MRTRQRLIVLTAAALTAVFAAALTPNTPASEADNGVIHAEHTQVLADDGLIHWQ